jgi:DNA-binding NarL/FixJ family response regulator
MTSLRLLIIAADPLARAGLAALLSQQANLTVVGQVAPDAELVAQTRTYQPDVVLWDLGWNSSAAVERLTTFTELGLPVLALLSHDAPAPDFWAAGVRGLLPREADGAHLAAALAALAQGLLVIDPSFTPLLPMPGASVEARPVETLTGREHEVLQALAEGLSNKQIARQLAISEHTVKFHINAILGKLGAQSRTEAVVRATRAGLILL